MRLASVNTILLIIVGVVTLTSSSVGIAWFNRCGGLPIQMFQVFVSCFPRTTLVSDGGATSANRLGLTWEALHNRIPCLVTSQRKAQRADDSRLHHPVGGLGQAGVEGGRIAVSEGGTVL